MSYWRIRPGETEYDLAARKELKRAQNRDAGLARARALSPSRRRAIGRLAALARWGPRLYKKRPSTASGRAAIASYRLRLRDLRSHGGRKIA